MVTFQLPLKDRAVVYRWPRHNRPHSVRNSLIFLTMKTQLAEQILAHAGTQPEGAPLTAKGFLQLGSRAAIDQALSRLFRAGKLLRTGRGMYVLPVKADLGCVPRSQSGWSRKRQNCAGKQSLRMVRPPRIA